MGIAVFCVRVRRPSVSFAQARGPSFPADPRNGCSMAGEQNVDTAKQAYDAFSAGDAEAAMALERVFGSR